MPRIRKQRLGRGQGLVTYALLLALVAIVVIVVIAALGDVIGATFCSVTYALMGANMPEIEYCETPRISCVGVANGATVSGPISLEAVVDDIRGPDNIQQVDFYVNDTLYRTEYISRYCLGAGDATCGGYNTSALPNGTHTIRAVVHDVDGNTNACSVTFDVSN